MGILGLIWAASVAQAATPVVYEGIDASIVLQRVSERTAVPIDQLEAVAADALVHRPAALAGPGTLRHCAAQPVRSADIRTLVLRAEVAWREGQPQDALDQLDLATMQLGCLSERVDHRVAARLFLVRGALQVHFGQAETAQAELQTALAFAPDLVWDPQLPVDAADALETARRAPAAAGIRVVPHLSTPPWLDGVPLATGETVQKRPGLHLVQIPATAGLQTAWMTVQGDATLVVPAAHRLPLLSKDFPEDLPGLGSLLQATLGAQATYLVTNDGMWLVTFDDGKPVMEVLVAPAQSQTTLEASEGKRKKK